MKNQPRAKAGFTLIEIMIVVGIIGMLAAMAIPNFIRARAASQQSACINNLRQIDAAKHQWGLEASVALSATPTSADLQPYLGRGSGSIGNVFCPQDPARTIATSYTLGDLSTAPVCIRQPATHRLP